MAVLSITKAGENVYRHILRRTKETKAKAGLN